MASPVAVSERVARTDTGPAVMRIVGMSGLTWLDVAPRRPDAGAYAMDSIAAGARRGTRARPPAGSVGRRRRDSAHQGRNGQIFVVV